jgi:ABC-type transport system substrate-binding protein
MKKFKWLAVVLAVVVAMTCVLAACNKKTEPEAPAEQWGEWKTVTAATCVSAGLEKRTSDQDNVETRAIAPLGHNFVNHICSRCGLSDEDPSVLEYGVDYISLYEQLGAKASIADVEEDAQGKAYIYVKDGKIAKSTDAGAVKTELGMDFLSMAMVYNTAVPADQTTWETEDDVYAEWWKLYIQRWNMLLPEIPLYSNEYYDMYNKKLGGVQEHPTNPYWGPAAALIDWTSSDDKIILGSSTDLSGKFRYASFGANSPGSSDNDVAGLTQGLATVTNTKNGGYEWDETVVKSHKETTNADGTLTFEIEINDDLKFSDGSAITAKNYLVTALAFSTPTAAKAAGKDHKAGMSYVGYADFAAYDGTNEGTEIKNASGKVTATAHKYFSGLRLLDTYKFSVTVSADYAGYYYKVIQASFSPSYLPMWLGNGVDIKDDGNGAYLDGNFYTDATVTLIKATAANTDTTYPYSGPYVVESYDAANKTATLKKNTYYKGNYEGTKPSIGTVVYKKVISATQLADFKAEGVYVLSAITGGDATNEAIAYAAGADGELGNADDVAIMTHYSRAGYGKLGFRADFGPVQFPAVRQAIAYCLNRPSFASQFTGGFGGVVEGPYYTGAWMYQEVKDEITLNKYTPSVESAKAALEADGWIYNADGTAYSGTGVRYKKFAEANITEKDRNFAAKDGSYKTVYDKENKCYYMPLVLNWYGTVDNEFSDILVKDMVLGQFFKQAGFVVKYTLGDFAPMLDELYQQQVYGYYGGTPTYTCFNFATGFNSAVYDYAYNWTIDPAMYDDYSINYVKDSADFYRLPKAE